MRSARAAVQHISLTDSRYARQASVAATSVAQHRRRNLIRASAAPFSTVEVRTARLRHETIPTDDAHASWPQAHFATAAARCIYGTRPHMPYSPATSGLTARTGMPYHNRKGIFPLAEISPYGDASAISRVLSPFTGVSIIYLRPQSPAASSNLPLDIGRATLNCRYTWSCNPQGVQPDDIAASAVGSYPAFSPLPADGTGRGRRLFSVTLLHPHGRRAVNSCGALRCSDFPPSAEADSDRARLHFLSLSSFFFDRTVSRTDAIHHLAATILHLPSAASSIISTPAPPTSSPSFRPDDIFSGSASPHLFHTASARLLLHTSFADLRHTGNAASVRH